MESLRWAASIAPECSVLLYRLWLLLVVCLHWAYFVVAWVPLALQIWDLRRIDSPVMTLQSQGRTLLQAVWCPFKAGLVASLSREEGRELELWDLDALTEAKGVDPGVLWGWRSGHDGYEADMPSLTLEPWHVMSTGGPTSWIEWPSVPSVSPRGQEQPKGGAEGGGDKEGGGDDDGTLVPVVSESEALARRASEPAPLPPRLAASAWARVVACTWGGQLFDLCLFRTLPLAISPYGRLR